MENDDLDIKADLPAKYLQDSSVIAFVSQLWGLPDVKQNVRNFFHQCFLNRYGKIIYRNVRKDDIYSPKISEIVLQKLSEYDLPQKLKIKIENKIWTMSKQIFDWLMHLLHNLKLGYVDTIYWTSNGWIDEERISKSLWMKLPEVDFERKEFDRFKPFFLFAQEEFIISHAKDIIKEIKTKIRLKRVDKSGVVFTILKIMVAYYYVFPVWKSTVVSDEAAIYITSISTVGVLEICQSHVLYKAFLYFWNHLDKTEQSKYLEEQSTKDFRTNFKGFYGTENIFQIALFMMNQMNVTQKHNFILHNFSYLLFMFSKGECFQNLCMPFLHKCFTRLEEGKVANLLEISAGIFSSSTIVNEDLHLEILKYLMKRTSSQLKSYAFLDDKNIMRNIFKSFKIPVLKVIFNDEDLQKYRNYFIVFFGREQYKELIQNNNLQLLNEFLAEIEVSESEYNYFQNKYNFLEDWIENGQFDIMDNVLNWMSTLNGNEKREHLLSLFYRFGETRKREASEPGTLNFMISLDKLLKWYFDTQEEPFINNCKNASLVKDLCRELIYNLLLPLYLNDFMDYKNEAIEISNKVLMSAFGSEEEIISFKKNELAEGCVKFFCERSNRDSDCRPEPCFSIVDEFFGFCSVTTEKIDGMKKLISDDINDWIDEYGTNVWRFNLVPPLLDWIYGNEVDNCEKFKSRFHHPDCIVKYYSDRDSWDDSKWEMIRSAMD